MGFDYTGITIERHGRLFEKKWHDQYKEKLISPDEAATFVKDGDRLYFTGGANYPQGFEQALAKQVKAKNLHLDIFTVFLLHKAEFTSAEYAHNIMIYDHFFGVERAMQTHHNISYIPAHLGQGGAVEKAFKPRICVMGCTPPNEDGWMSRSLLAHHSDKDIIHDPNVDLLIIEINQNLPFCHTSGEEHTLIHVSEADYLIQSNNVWPEIKMSTPSDVDRKIGDYISELAKDGDCLQVGLGGLADVVTNNLKHAGLKDLGLHSELLTNGLVTLLNEGIINNSKKTLYPNKSIVTACIGDKSLWEYCETNKDYYLLNVGFVNDPRNICKNRQVLSINNCMELDLMGQVNSESVGFRQYSGTGGQLQFVVGSQWSEGGRSVIALNAVYQDKNGNLQSKIMPCLPPGSAVSTPRSCVNYIVTEFGMVDLKFKSIRERAKLLISIAHPQFREELTFEAKKCGYLI